MENNSADSLWTKVSTRVTKTVSVPGNTTEVDIDFSDSLLFPANGCAVPPVCSLGSSWKAVAVAAKPATKTQNPGKIKVALSEQLQEDGVAQLTCTCDQSRRSAGAHWKEEL